MKTYWFNYKVLASLVLILVFLAACGGEKPTATLVPTVSAPTAQAQPEATAAPETGEQPATIPPSSYQNITWSWVGFSDPVDGPQDIPQPERYQITLNPDGTISVKADCNMVSGSYTVEGSNITIELGPSTMAMCPEDSLADPFTQHLTAARIMFFDGDDMLLTPLPTRARCASANRPPQQRCQRSASLSTAGVKWPTAFGCWLVMAMP